MMHNVMTAVITLVITDKSLRTAVVNSFKQIGADHKRSQAPRGALEDELQKWLSTVQASAQS